MSRVSNLFRLQSMDLELDQQRRRLAEISRLLDDNAAVQAARRGLLEIQTRLDATRVRLRSAEHDGQALQIKMAEVEQQLYSGSVHNAKVLQDLQADLESLRRRRAANEETQLEALLEIETAEAGRTTSEASLNQAEAAAAHSLSHLTAERAALTERAAQLESDRASLWQRIPAEDQTLYERLRHVSPGRPVAVVDDGACGLCGVEVSPHDIQLARQGADLARCDNCERILYME